ncbi:MAG: hypothetical protein Q9213_004857 [Squamulea squamosa]
MFLAGCVQNVITGHSIVVDDSPVTSETEHMAEKVPRSSGLSNGNNKAHMLVVQIWIPDYREDRLRPHQTIDLVPVAPYLWQLTAWSVAFFFATVFQCGLQWSLNWGPILVFLTECSNTLDMLTVFTATDILTDLLIIAMPVPMIWSLQMSVRRKIAINAMFLVGFFNRESTTEFTILQNAEYGTAISLVAKQERSRPPEPRFSRGFNF